MFISFTFKKSSNLSRNSSRIKAIKENTLMSFLFLLDNWKQSKGVYERFFFGTKVGTKFVLQTVCVQTYLSKKKKGIYITMQRLRLVISIGKKILNPISIMLIHIKSSNKNLFIYWLKMNDWTFFYRILLKE